VKRGIALIRFALLGFAGSALPASAQELELTWEADAARSDVSARVVVVRTLSGPHALVAGIDVSHLVGTFVDDEGQARFSSPGAAALLGYRLESARARLTLAPGYEVRRTWERPRGGVPSRRDERGATAQLEAALDLGGSTDLDGALIASEVDRYRWARVALTRRLLAAGAWAASAGPEGAYEASFESRSTQLGAVLLFESTGSGSGFELRAGWSNLGSSVEGRRYLGAGLSKEW